MILFPPCYLIACIYNNSGMPASFLHSFQFIKILWCSGVILQYIVVLRFMTPVSPRFITPVCVFGLILKNQIPRNKAAGYLILKTFSKHTPVCDGSLPGRIKAFIFLTVPPGPSYHHQRYIQVLSYVNQLFHPFRNIFLLSHTLPVCPSIRSYPKCH